MALGTSSIPAASNAAKKQASRKSVAPTCPGDTPAPAATAVNAARNTIARRSSTSSTPNTRSRSGPDTFKSSKALATMVVLATATMAPVKTLSSTVQPSARPTA